MKNVYFTCCYVFIVSLLLLPGGVYAAQDAVKIGLSYPETGPYAKQGLDQRRAADLAVEDLDGPNRYFPSELSRQSTLGFEHLFPDDAIRLLGETSGKNALVITAAADEDAAIRDLVRSAFGHAGQKCSAASLGIIEASVYDDPQFMSRLADAVTQPGREGLSPLRTPQPLSRCVRSRDCVAGSRRNRRQPVRRRRTGLTAGMSPTVCLEGVVARTRPGAGSGTARRRRFRRSFVLVICVVARARRV